MSDTGRHVLHAAVHAMEKRTVDGEVFAKKSAPAGAMVTTDHEVGIWHRRQSKCYLRGKVMKKSCALIVSARDYFVRRNRRCIAHASRSSQRHSQITVPRKICPSGIESDPHLFLVKRTKSLPNPRLNFICHELTQFTDDPRQRSADERAVAKFVCAERIASSRTYLLGRCRSLPPNRELRRTFWPPKHPPLLHQALSKRCPTVVLGTTNQRDYRGAVAGY